LSRGGVDLSPRVRRVGTELKLETDDCPVACQAMLLDCGVPHVALGALDKGNSGRPMFFGSPDIA